VFKYVIRLPNAIVDCFFVVVVVVVDINDVNDWCYFKFALGKALSNVRGSI